MVKFKFSSKGNFRRAFTLIEIMLTVAIITAVAVVSIQNIIRLRINANRAMTQEDMRSIHRKIMEINVIKGRFPTSEEWDNLAMTASLSGLEFSDLNICSS